MINSILFPSEVCSALPLPRPPHPQHHSFWNPAEKKTSQTNGLWSGKMCAFHWKTPPREKTFKAWFPGPGFRLSILLCILGLHGLCLVRAAHASLCFQKCFTFSLPVSENTLGALKPNYSYPPEYICVEGINQVCQTLSCETFNISKKFKASIFITCIVENNLSFL